jgi:hypothetical protein
MAVEFNWIGRGASRVPEDTQLREQKAWADSNCAGRGEALFAVAEISFGGSLKLVLLGEQLWTIFGG